MDQKKLMEPLKLAAQDLAKDIQMATGHAVAPSIVQEKPSRDGIVIRIQPEAFSEDAVENWRLHSEPNNMLFIDGSVNSISDFVVTVPVLKL